MSSLLRVHLLALTSALCASGAEAGPPSRSELDQTTDGFVDPRQVFSDHPSPELDGAHVFLEDVPVRSKSGNGLWVGYRGCRQVFVVPIDPSFLDFVAVGATVDLRGTLRDAPAPAQAKKIWALDAKSTRRIAKETYYIDAWTISYLN